MNMKRIAGSSFFLVSNYHTYGIQHAMLAFLRQQGAKKILFLNHPLHGVAKDNTTTVETYGQSPSNLRIPRRKAANEPLGYVADLLLTIRLGLKLSEPVDVFVGFNSLNALAGVILKLLGKVRFVINYSHSYKAKRYKNIISNMLYKLTDRCAVGLSDSTWGLGAALFDIRKKQGVPKRKIVTTHDGVDTDLIRPSVYDPKQRFRLVFVGLINEINGLEIAIRALRTLVMWNKRVCMDVIGEGELEEGMRTIVKRDKMERHVRFLGVQSIESLAKLLPRCGVGIATYKPVPHSTLATTDPMKTKLYMAAGLPIVSTDIYKSAHEIKDHALGELIPYDEASYVRAVKKIMEEKRHKTYRDNCIAFVKKYDWHFIFRDSFRQTGFEALDWKYQHGA